MTCRRRCKTAEGRPTSWRKIHPNWNTNHLDTLKNDWHPLPFIKDSGNPITRAHSSSAIRMPLHMWQVFLLQIGFPHESICRRLEFLVAALMRLYEKYFPFRILIDTKGQAHADSEPTSAWRLIGTLFFFIDDAIPTGDSSSSAPFFPFPHQSPRWL